MTASPFWHGRADGVTVAVKVTPRARRPGLGGVAEDQDGLRLQIAVREAPEDGRANRAACAALAEVLDTPPSRVSVIAGASNRRKTMHVQGDPAQLAERLAAL